MKSSKNRGAFTLIELLIVIAIIALLISILLPSLERAREQGRRAVCLANLKAIATAIHSYATEDAAEHAVPVHQAMIDPMGRNGWSTPYWWRTAVGFSYGGKTASVPFPQPNPTPVMMDPDGIWAAETRPLNRFVLGSVHEEDSRRIEWYHCPSDVGYPNSEWIEDVPQAAAEIPCYEMLGNSYRFRLEGVVAGGGRGETLPYGIVSPYPVGHRLSTLLNTARLPIISEPLFMNFLRQREGDDPGGLSLRGWHKMVMTSNVLFTDGSARPTRTRTTTAFDQESLEKMGYTTAFPQTQFLTRCDSYQADCYPTPGALIPVGKTGERLSREWLSDQTGWPFAGFQGNIRLE